MLTPAYAGRDDLLVLALPRGGVPVAYEVANALNAPLDVFLVRKLGVPGHEELAFGAVASGGGRVLNADVVRWLDLTPEVIERVTRMEREEIRRRERAYRDDLPYPDVSGKTVLLIDDGLATGATMRAATRALHRMEPTCLIAAVPVASRDTCEDLRSEVNEIICVRTPEPFRAVGYWYEDFSPTTDAEVRELLDRARIVGSGPIQVRLPDDRVCASGIPQEEEVAAEPSPLPG
jgi:predicted phosphoribosyltransferase